MATLEKALTRVERRLARQGKIRLPHETWVEFSRRAEDDVLHGLVAAYCRVRFAGDPWTADMESRLRKLR